MRSKLDTIAKISTEINVINSVAIQNLNLNETQTKNYWLFMSDFFEIVWISWVFSWLSDVDMLAEKWRKLCIVISCDAGICGSLNKRLFAKVKKVVDSDTDLFCVGKKSFNYFLDQWFNVVWCINDCKNSTDLEILNQYLSNSINKKVYSQVVVFSHSNRGVENFDLYTFSNDELQKFMKKFDVKYAFGTKWNVNCVMDDVSFKNAMMVQLSQYIVYGAWLSTKNAEYSHCRAVSQLIAHNNFVKKCILSFNEKRQTLLTQKVMELMSLEYSMS